MTSWLLEFVKGCAPLQHIKEEKKKRMTIEEIKARVKQNLEDRTTEKLCKEAGFTDKAVGDILRVCKRAVEGVYGDDIFSPEHNIYLRHLGEIEE